MKPFKRDQIERKPHHKGLFSAKNKWLVFTLIGIFILVLFLNSYFNYSSGIAINEDGSSFEEKFLLSGPDPYYNMRLVQVTMETGQYPFLNDEDPLLNYPFGRSGARPPIFNMITVAVSKVFTPFLGESDALGYSMHILPALYGALLIIPVYLIGNTLFGRKVGIIAALFTALIPIHLSSGHGSAYSLYDHDSFNLLLFTFTFFFIIKSLREKEWRPSLIYGCLAGTTMAAISMSWAAGRFIYAVIAVYAIVQMLADIVTKKPVVTTARATVIPLFSGIIIAAPYLFLSGFSFRIELILAFIVAVFSGICYFLQSRNIPWVLSIPAIFTIGGITAVFLYIIRDVTTGILGQIARLSFIIYGDPVYGSKVSETIAEAGTFGFSRNVMSLGPVIYLLAWMGFVFLVYRYFKTKRRSYLFLLTIFIIQIWLSSTAGRFINDLVPLMTLFAGWITWIMIEKINFSEMVKTVKGIGGGWYGIKKGVKIRHMVGIVFIGLFILFPNGWMAFDASVPSTLKQDFGIEGGAFGLSLHTEEYWIDALSWFNKQDNELEPADRPGFISWWDYGFYESATGGHPTVADNFQNGIPPASNFHTATDEQEAISVLIIRILDAVKSENGGKLPPEIIPLLDSYLGNYSTRFLDILYDPIAHSYSYDQLIGKDYGNNNYRVRAETAIYHDGVEILSTLNDAELTWLYHHIQNMTGYSIRYYGVEGYDINIFNVFSFLSDKGVFGYATDEDEYFKLVYVDEFGGEYTPDEITNMTQDEREALGNINPQVIRKDAFFDSMVYKTYLGGAIDKATFEQYFTTFEYSGYVSFLVQPTAGLRHFVPKYISPVTDEKPFYFARGSLCRGCPAVVIAKYYEGAYINGTLTSNGKPISAVVSILDDYRGYSHDAVLTDDKGNFHLIAPAGNISLRITPGGGGQSQTTLQTIVFNSTTNPQLFPISEAEAMRQPNTNYSRTIDINLPRGTLEGIAFWDKDGDGRYNTTIDELLKDTKIQLVSVTTQTNSRGYYSIKNLIPGEYSLSGIKNGYNTQTSSVVIKPGETMTQNISMIPATVQVKGEAWFDQNNNNRVDTNETMPGVPIQLTITKALDQNSENKTITTNQTGHYQIDLIPATYSIQVNYTVESDSITFQYIYTSTLQIRIGDGPKTKNIKLERIQQ